MGPVPDGLTRAAVWHGGDAVTVETLPLPELGAHDVLVRIRLATVCGSDLHTVSGRRSSPRPSVLGHEAVGDVVAVGAAGSRAVDGSPVRVGDRVVWGVTVTCGSCDRCLLGRSAKCRRVRKVGHESLTSDWPLSGGYAEHIHLPGGATLVHVPQRVDDAVAAPAACATGTVVAAVERAGDLTGRRVTVCGAGMLGLTAVAVCVAAGAAEVTVSDLDPDRLTLAKDFGATALVGADEPLPDADVALDFSGSSVAVEAALASLDIGGTLVLAGSVSPSEAVLLDPERVVRSWLTVTGVHNYEPRHLQQAVDFLAGPGRDHPWADLVEPPRPLDAIGSLLVTPPRGRLRSAVTP